jgi:hypothetical protein
VRIPRGSQKTAWEAELGALIGSCVRYLTTPQDGLTAMARYVELEIDQLGREDQHTVAAS